MQEIYLITGGNVGDRKNFLLTACRHIESKVGSLINKSSIYETAAWGNTNQPAFYNQVLHISTKLKPEDLMQTLLEIEKTMGRIRTTRNAARIIDIDILFYGKEIVNTPNLNIPHIEIPNRRFVLAPMNELAPHFIHPVLHKTIQELLFECKDPLEAKPLKEAN